MPAAPNAKYADGGFYLSEEVKGGLPSSETAEAASWAGATMPSSVWSPQRPASENGLSFCVEAEVDAALWRAVSLLSAAFLFESVRLGPFIRGDNDDFD